MNSLGIFFAVLVAGLIVFVTILLATKWGRSISDDDLWYFVWVVIITIVVFLRFSVAGKSVWAWISAGTVLFLGVLSYWAAWMLRMAYALSDEADEED